MISDLVRKGASVIDPSQGIDRVTDLAFAKGRVSAVGCGLTGTTTRDLTGQVVTPGLIDLHTHLHWDGTSPAVDADAYSVLRKSGHRFS